MAELLQLKIMTPTETLLDVRGVTNIKIRLADHGSIGLQPGHAPLMAETVTAPINYVISESDYSFDAQAGILFVEPGIVTIFTSGRGEFEIADPGAERFDRLASALLNRMGARSGDGPGNNG